MSTKLRTLFSKPVDRPIDGVIKADDEESLLIELEEYVVTNEIEKNISRFLSDYNNYTNKNGIWISGFFGSGKSHLLKMLSLVLEDKNVEGQSAAEIFLKKVSHDAFLQFFNLYLIRPAVTTQKVISRVSNVDLMNAAYTKSLKKNFANILPVEFHGKTVENWQHLSLMQFQKHLHR